MNELLILTVGLTAGFFLHWLVAYYRQRRGELNVFSTKTKGCTNQPEQSNNSEKNLSSEAKDLNDTWQKDTWLDEKPAFEASTLIQYASRQDSFFNIVLGFIPCQVFIKDPLDGFRYKVANRNFTDYYQLEPEDVLEHPDEDIFDKDVAQQLRRHDIEVCDNPGKVFRFDEDISYRRRGREVFKSLKVCFETDDHHPYMLGICVDITDLHNRIQMDRVNNEAISQAVAESDFRKVVEKSIRTLRKELNCARVIFLTCSTEGKLKLFCEDFAAYHQPIQVNELENREKIWNFHLDRLKKNELIAYENLHNVPELNDIQNKNPNDTTYSMAMTPIFIDDELYGGLLISYSGHHFFRETDKELLRTMSKIVSLAALRDRQTRYMRQAEQENQALLDNISIPLWLHNTSGCIVQTNKAADRLLGIPDRNLPYFCRYLLKHEKQCEECPVRSALQGENPGQIRCKYKNRNYMVKFNPITDPVSDVIHGVVSSYYDVTEMDTAILSRQVVNNCLINLVREADMHKAIEKSIQEICEFLGASRCYIMQFDSTDRTISCYLEYIQGQNPTLSWIQKHQYSDKTNWEERFGKSPLLSFPDRESLSKEGELASHQDSFDNNNVESAYFHRIMLSDQLWGYLSVIYEQTPHELTTTEHDFIGSIAYCIELLLVRQQYQTRVLDALRHAEAADKAKSMFLASVSHEIRTPLNAVIGFSELLKDGPIQKETESDYLNAISNAGKNLLDLINDVLDLSKLETGQMTFTPAEVDFPGLVREVGNIFQQKCMEKNLLFKVDITGNIPRLLIDKLRLRQILFNLVGNAVKFTEKGSITVNIRYDIQSDNQGTLRFSVADTGIGISDEDQKQIFQIFVQARAIRGTQAEQNGTGLGLAICKQMIEKMNGQFLLDSVPGKGSEFTVILHNVPWSIPKVGEEPILKSEGGDYIICAPKNILIADDVAMNLKVLTALLKKLGQKVLTANNADEALTALEQNHVDIILTDLWMPGMNGAELATTIRKSGKYPNLAIAIITADVQGEENFDLSDVDMIMTKPITVDKLRSFFDRYMNAAQEEITDNEPSTPNNQ